jgi:DNA (cytosine-5)-methyltransferase 1
MEVKYFDLFSGAGGFSLALPEYYKCVGMSEIDPYCNIVLKYRFPSTKNYGNIESINFDEVPKFEILFGGSPCQGFSLAGERKGLTDPRSRLFAKYIECLEVCKPKFFVWENVEGCLRSNDGRDFAAILLEFSRVGYSIQWQLLNAKNFGVPQNRPRVFITGYFGTEKERLQIPIRGIENTLTPKAGISLPDDVISRCVMSLYGKNPSDATYILHENLNAVRRMTPIECERLQGWPDDWTKYGLNSKNEIKVISDRQRYKMIGNGVCTNMVRSVLESMNIYG